MKQVRYKDLENIQRKALDEAENVMELAYAPYSNFLVGAVLYRKDGTIIGGANYENASYGATVCAERSAVFRANAMGYRAFDGVALIARGKDFDLKEVNAPCGICRQVLFEVASISQNELPLIMSDTKKKKIIIATIQELLPLAFGPVSLGIDILKYKR